MHKYFKENIKVQAKLMLCKKGFLISFSFMMILSLLSYIDNVMKLKGMDRFLCQSPEYQFILNDFNNHSGIWFSIFPFIIIFPFGFSLIHDRTVKISELLIVRGGKKEYYVSKAMITAMGAFLICFIPLVVNNFLNSVTFYDGVTSMGWFSKLDFRYSSDLMGTNVMVKTSFKGVPLVGLFVRNPILYNYVWSFFVSVVAGMISVFIYACSFFIKRYTVFLLLPFYIIIIVLQGWGSSLQLKNHMRFSFYKYIGVSSLYGRNYVLFGMLIGGLLLMGLLLIRREYRKDF